MPWTRKFEETPLPLFEEAEPVPLVDQGRLPSYIRDHRARLRERFNADAGAAMPDYEILELVLFDAQARLDTKPIARALLEEFGDFNAVISAEPARLTAVKGVGDVIATRLKVVQAAA